MTKTIRLNDLQLVLLSNALARDNGSLMPLPESCTQDTTRIGKEVDSLLRRGLVEGLPATARNLAWREEDQDFIGLFITDAGRNAICGGAEKSEENATDPATPENGEPATRETNKPANQDQNEATEAATTTSKDTSPRAGTKIGTVMALLRRNEGATLDEMVVATGWLPHTTRAALTGLKKKGHAIAKTKRGDVTCYHIADEA